MEYIKRTRSPNAQKNTWKCQAEKRREKFISVVFAGLLNVGDIIDIWCMSEDVCPGTLASHWERSSQDWCLAAGVSLTPRDKAFPTKAFP
jgi:hypothetical protein